MKNKQQSLLRVYSTVTGEMHSWIKEGEHFGKEKIFYSANSIAPLINLLRSIKCEADLDKYKAELLKCADNINMKEENSDEKLVR